MGVSIEIALPGDSATDVLVLPVAEPFEPRGEGARIVDEKLGGRLTRLAGHGDVRGEVGRTFMLPLDGELAAPRLLTVGLGKRDAVDAGALRAAGAAAAAEGVRHGSTLTWLLDETLTPDVAQQAAALVGGTLLGAYDPGRWKTGARDRKPLERVVVGHFDEPELRRAVERAAVVAERVNSARDLVNAPPNELTPTALAEHARDLADRFEHLQADALGPAQIAELGMGAFTAVARGSAQEPRLVVLRYEPPGAREDLLLGLAGKAVTFDAGGISIKPANNLERMKGDMGGGAGVLEGIGAIAALGLPLRVLALVGATENVLDGASYRPGDILRSASGKTIEIVNTDAEGRLVLADVLWYARREGATHLLDLATLTGAMRTALGDLYGGLFANDDAWRDLVVEAGRRSGDLVWPFPLHPRYRRYIDSAFADMKNGSTLRQASPALAAEFLHEFVGEGPWAHVDMAGPGFLERSRGDVMRVPGGTGYGVRLIAEIAGMLA